MKTSCNLSSTPFLGFSDSTRLQMSSKQLGQTITSTNCQIPKVVGKNYTYLSDTSRMFQQIAPLPGTIVFTNQDIMIVIFQGDIIKIFDVAINLHTSEVFATKLRFKREVGRFKTGDLLFEFDGFKSSIPSFGYNTLTAFMPFFGFNFEDSIVLSQEVANTFTSTKIEKISIPIYTYSLFKSIYNSDYGILPKIGESIQDSTIALEYKLKNNQNVVRTLKMMDLSNFMSVLDNNSKFNTIPIISRLNNAKISDLRIHKINKHLKLIDKNLQNQINRLNHDYGFRIKKTYESLSQIFNQDYVRHIISNNYMLLDSIKRYKIQLKDLAYLIEITLVKEEGSHIGDKFANRLNKNSRFQ